MIWEVHRNERPNPWTYALAEARQREVAESLLVDVHARGIALRSEFAPVITLGRRAQDRSCAAPGSVSLNDLTAPMEAYAARGIEIRPTQRGGRATYHGPGQWVIFLVDRLERLTGDRRGVRRLVEGLLEAAQATAREAGVDIEVRQDAALGLWSAQGKLASVGLEIRDGIALHGISFNFRLDPLSFWGVRPCGMDAQAGALFQTLTEADFEAWGERFQAHVSRVFSLTETPSPTYIKRPIPLVSSVGS